jgi:hypothetical protein
VLFLLYFSRGNSQAETCDVSQDGTCLSDDPSLTSSDLVRHVEIGWGETQLVTGEQSSLTLKNIETTRKYMESEVYKKDEYREVRDECQCRDKDCSFWAAIGKFRHVVCCLHLLVGLHLLWQRGVSTCGPHKDY